MSLPKEIDISKFKKCKRITRDVFPNSYQVEDKTGQLYEILLYGPEDDRIFKNLIPIMILANYPTIIKFIGYSKTDFRGENNITLITEFFSDFSLFNLLEQARRSICSPNYANTERQIIMIGIASGIKFLHDHGIIHLDIKPKNILLDENFHPKITGLDLSFFIKNGIEYHGGTFVYMAPEIIKGEEYNKEVDIHLVSCCMKS